MNVQTLQNCLTVEIDKKVNTIVPTVADRIKNAILTAIGNIFTSRIELGVGARNASFSVTLLMLRLIQNMENLQGSLVVLATYPIEILPIINYLQMLRREGMSLTT